MTKHLPTIQCPFENESEALSLGDFTVENREDRISFYGSLDITLDQEGLRNTQTLLELLQKVMEALKKKNLPEHIHTRTSIIKDSPL